MNGINSNMAVQHIHVILGASLICFLSVAHYVWNDYLADKSALRFPILTRHVFGLETGHRSHYNYNVDVVQLRPGVYNLSTDTHEAQIQHDHAFYWTVKSCQSLENGDHPKHGSTWDSSCEYWNRQGNQEGVMIQCW